MKGIRDLKRSSENNVNYTISDSANTAINKMDQEIIQNYKLKVIKLEEELRNTKDDFESLRRNFDALTLKAKMDVEKIKQLEEELSKLMLSTKLNNNQITDKKEETDLNDKLEKLEQKYIDKINILNSKMIENDSLNSKKIAKLLENEKNLKIQVINNDQKYNNLVKSKEAVDNELSLLKMKLKNCMEENEKNLATTRKNYESLLNSNLEKNSKHYEKIINEKDEEINNLRNATKGLLEKNKVTLNKTMNTESQYEKLKKENEIYSKLVDEYKEKLRNKDSTIYTIQTESDERKENFKKIIQQYEDHEKKIMNDKKLLEKEVLQFKEENYIMLDKLNDLELNYKTLKAKYEDLFNNQSSSSYESNLEKIKQNLLDHLDKYTLYQNQLLLGKINESNKKIEIVKQSVRSLVYNLNTNSNEDSCFNEIRIKLEEEILLMKNNYDILNHQYKTEVNSLKNELQKQGELLYNKSNSINELQNVLIKLQNENESYVNLISSSNKKLIKIKEDHENKVEELKEQLERFRKEIEIMKKEKEELMKKAEIDKEKLKAILDIKNVHSQIKGVVGKVNYKLTKNRFY